MITVKPANIHRKTQKTVYLMEDGRYKIDTSYFLTSSKPGRFAGYVSNKFIEEFGPVRHPEDEIEDRHKNMASSLQKLYEETIFHVLRKLYKITGEKKVCLSGGGALNCVMNGKIFQETPFEKVYVPPSPGDSGCSLGAALYLKNCILKHKRSFVMKIAYWGPSFTEGEIKRVLDEAKLSYKRSDNLAAETASLLLNGYIVGWFQGRMEWGPCALGSRSILADLTRADMTDIVNRYVKHREDFRPFALSVLKEHARDFFDLDPSPFMSFVCKVKSDKTNIIPAVVHVDGTARPQIVEKDLNPLYWNLISEFKRLKEVPVILNTS